MHRLRSFTILRKPSFGHQNRETTIVKCGMGGCCTDDDDDDADEDGGAVAAAVKAFQVM